MKIFKLISNFLQSNTFVLQKDNEALIIDAGTELNKVKEVVGDKKVVAVLLTHGHYDHAYYCNEYSKEFNAPIYINRNGKTALSDPKYNYGETFKIEDFSSFKFLEGDGKLTLGNFEIEYIYTPGHSNCLNSYLIDNALFVGDCIFRDGIGRTDLITSNNDDMLESLKKLCSLQYEMCYSGHYEDSDYARMNKNSNVYIRFLSRKK